MISIIGVCETLLACCLGHTIPMQGRCGNAGTWIFQVITPKNP